MGREAMNRAGFIKSLGLLALAPVAVVRALVAKPPCRSYDEADLKPFGPQYPPGQAGKLVRVIIYPVREYDENGVPLHYSRSLAHAL